MVNAFDQCGDGCGWIAAIVAALAYGSFGVPVKYTKHIPVHPLVLQSYKTVIVFLTCWFVLLLGVKASFTKWGILSGFLWVVGGTGGIYGIRMAGLAIAVGTWASIMIMVNFLFGIVIFREPVHDILGTLASFLLLILGLVGMSHYSAPQKQSTTINIDASHNGTDPPGRAPLEDPLTDGQIVEIERNESDDNPHFRLFGLPLNKRQCGILGAAMNGLFTGGSLIPLHYAKMEGFGGANYIISMASGALLSNIFLWVAFYLYNVYLSRDSGDMGGEALKAMPRLYLKELLVPGSFAGVLLAIAMFGSILAVTYLGQGVGNSLVQTKILISGLWGIFYYGEIRGMKTISMWFVSATVAVIAIVWLSLERLLATSDDQDNDGGHRLLQLAFDL